MKKIIILFAVMCASATMVMAQGQAVSSKIPATAADVYTPSSAPVSTINKHRGVGDPFPSTIGSKIVVGKTTYDLQTNGALQNRIVTDGNNVHAAWTMSHETSVTANSAYTDRGTGYAFYNGTAWGAAPTSRVEDPGPRTGFGGMAINGNGNVVYVTHSAAYNIILNEKTTNGWTTTTTTLSNTNTAIWPDVATSGNWMYVICASQDSLTMSNGIRNGYFFSRSNDNGATWIDNMIPMPMIDSAGHYRGGGNSYSISARDSNVAIVFGDFGTDLTLLRSTDYGATWTRTVLWDWPIDYYNTSNMTDTNGDNVPDTLFTIDGSMDIAMDAGGEVHVAFPIFRIYNDGPANPGYNFYPATGRMIYYNSIGDSLSLVDNILADHHVSCDGDTSTYAYGSNYTTDPGGASYNTTCLLTMPQVTVNESNDDVFITYTATMDGDRTEIDIAHPYWLGITGIDEQPYRDVVVLPSKNNGGTWGYPVNITRTRHYEEVFVSVPERVTGADPTLHFLYQGDIEPGTIMQNDDVYDQDFENWMIHQEVSASAIHTKSNDFDAPCNQFELPLALNEVTKLANGSVKIYPNPAVEFITVELDLDNMANEVSYELYDLAGRMIKKVNSSNVAQDKVQINIQSLSAGNYILKVNADDAISSHKVSVK